MPFEVPINSREYRDFLKFENKKTRYKIENVFSIQFKRKQEFQTSLDDQISLKFMIFLNRNDFRIGK